MKLKDIETVFWQIQDRSCRVMLELSVLFI